jgi:RNA:NAD 2'-phosphotransferase (TPT1/KptA family)
MEMIWVSRELAYLLRHGAKSAGLPIRTDGYVEVEALVRVIMALFVLLLAKQSI